MIRLVATDLDGTLVDHNNFISIDNLNATKAIYEKNINLAICTGKTYSISKDICNKCNASYGIFGNGTQIINLETGAEIYSHSLTPSDFSLCYDIAKKHKLHIHFYTDNSVVSEELKYMDLRNFTISKKNQSNSITFNIVDNIKNFVDINKPKIFKLIISSDSTLINVQTELSQKLNLNFNLVQKRGKYKDFVINKEYDYIDITPANLGKATALSYLSNFLSVNTSEIMAIGDNKNDIDMLKLSGISVTLADSYDEVKQIASYTTKNSVAESGFAEAIQKFVL